MIADGLMEDGICTPSGGEKWYPSTVASILENEKYAGDLLMQKWYVEDYLTAESLSNSNYKLPENKTTAFKISKAASLVKISPKAKTLTYNEKT